MRDQAIEPHDARQQTATRLEAVARIERRQRAVLDVAIKQYEMRLVARQPRWRGTQDRIERALGAPSTNRVDDEQDPRPAVVGRRSAIFRIDRHAPRIAPQAGKTMLNFALTLPLYVGKPKEGWR